MNVIVTGSLAYDRIMDFPGSFREHILPDKVHMLNVSFRVESLKEKFGGTAGNIAHNLKLIGFDPVILSAGGRDFGRYKAYLEHKGIRTEYIAIDEQKHTAVGNIITDLDDNQITAFYGGAYELSASLDLPKELARKDAMLIIAASSKQEITKRCLEARTLNIPFLFDPGQEITALSAEELLYGAENSRITLFNDYEWEMFRKKTNRELDDLTGKGVVVIVTQGAQGSVVYTRELESDLEIGIAKPREVIDPTGAGDAYRAGIVAGYLNQWDWRQAGELAATIASFAVEKYGTQEHNPSMDEINERYQQNFNTPSPFISPKSIPSMDLDFDQE